MGQQQLLIVILVTIVVGIATFVAINTFQQAHDESAYDAVRQDILQAQAQSKAFYLKSISMGGGGGTFSEISLKHLLLTDYNENANYEIDETSVDDFTLSYTPHFNQRTYTVTIRFDEIIWNGEKEE
jgi:Tfp pilus assembly protein PilE